MPIHGVNKGPVLEELSFWEFVGIKINFNAALDKALLSLFEVMKDLLLIFRILVNLCERNGAWMIVIDDATVEGAIA